MQLVCNYNGNVMLMLFSSIHKQLTHSIMGIFGWKQLFFEILISTIHYDYSFYMVLDCDSWCNQNFPCGMLIEFWEIKIKIKIYLSS
jgi:hypothetical protein